MSPQTIQQVGSDTMNKKGLKDKLLDSLYYKDWSEKEDREIYGIAFCISTGISTISVIINQNLNKFSGKSAHDIEGRLKELNYI
jgi:hypothetical protein